MTLNDRNRDLAQKMQQIKREDKPIVGKKLSNGAICIDAELVEEGERELQYVVLAVVEGGYEPYVSWKYGIGATDLATGGFDRVSPAAWSGHYTRTLEAAVAEFQLRSGRLKEGNK